MIAIEDSSHAGSRLEDFDGVFDLPCGCFSLFDNEEIGIDVTQNDGGIVVGKGRGQIADAHDFIG